MQTRISHWVFLCLLMLAFPLMPVMADDDPTPSGPDFPPDPGVVYVPPTVVIMGDTIPLSDNPEENPKEIDLFNDGTAIYNTEENSLTLDSLDMTSEEMSEGTFIGYSGTDTLTIELCNGSRIVSDTIIASESDVVLKGDGKLEAVGTVPIIGVPSASITIATNMHVQSVPSRQELRRFIRSGAKFGKKVDETGGPALSGFGSADFGKVNVSPSDAYGPIEGSGDDPEDPEDDVNALYDYDEEGNQVVVTEFETTVKDEEDALPQVKTRHNLDITQPMYNILGLPVDASYKGLVIQQGQTYLLK